MCARASHAAQVKVMRSKRKGLLWELNLGPLALSENHATRPSSRVAASAARCGGLFANAWRNGRSHSAINCTGLLLPGHLWSSGSDVSPTRSSILARCIVS